VKTLETAIIGAGPYGLSIAAHLNNLGRNYRIYGRPMDTWRNHMPKGMLLKSDGFASNLSAPMTEHSLRSYCARNVIRYDDLAIPVSLNTFVDYSLDFLSRFVLGVDEQRVVGLRARESGFRLRLDDGDTVDARRVVLAVGITHFDHVPATLRALPPELVSHSSAHHNLDRFKGRDVTVIGAGASAVDLAVLLDEAGAKVRLVARGQEIRFGSEPKRRRKSRWERLRHPQSGLGPGLKSRIYSDFPQLFRHLPSRLRLEIVRRHLGPASAWHLRPRVVGRIPTILDHALIGAEIHNDRVQLSLQSPNGVLTLKAEHVIAATGYRADVDRLGFIDEELRSRISRVGQMPKLSSNFESSVRGLYFVGLAAAGSFGPLLRFVHGCDFAARRISQDIVQREQ
jgi:thioredoxin reductase